MSLILFLLKLLCAALPVYVTVKAMKGLIRNRGDAGAVRMMSNYARHSGFYTTAEDLEEISDHIREEEAMRIAIGDHTQHEVSFEQEGPSAEYLKYYKYTHPCAQGEDLVTIIELEVSVHDYLAAESNLRLLNLELMRDDLRMRCHIAQMRVFIMTGRTELAVREFAEHQNFSERYLAQTEVGMLGYLDCAATICALTGDFEESVRYCEAMKQYVQNRRITDMNCLMPAITEIKRLFLQNRVDDGYAAMRQIKSEIESFPRYQYPWQSAFLLERLELTEMFIPVDESEIGADGGMPTI